jgi:phosphatidylserine/phosphatidylglycerophosphate/cardiolipin synthase-like enzyme
VAGNRAEVLLNGDEIFPAMLAAIQRARTTITFANYIYEDGDITRTMATALAERLAFLDRVLAAKLTRVFKEDLAFTKPVTLDDWERHGLRNLFYLPMIPLRDQL